MWFDSQRFDSHPLAPQDAAADASAVSDDDNFDGYFLNDLDARVPAAEAAADDASDDSGFSSEYNNEFDDIFGNLLKMTMILASILDNQGLTHLCSLRLTDLRQRTPRRRQRRLHKRLCLRTDLQSHSSNLADRLGRRGAQWTPITRSQSLDKEP